MTDREALRRAVCADPEDDTPRLVFADWLEEYGSASDQAWAEFIRAEIELSVLLRDGMPSIEWFRANRTARLPQLMVRRGDLFGTWRVSWFGQLPALERVRWVWLENRRGFADEVAAHDGEAFLRAADEVFAAAPVRRLWVGEEIDARFAASPALGRLRRVQGQLPADAAGFARAVEALVANPALAALERLTLYRAPWRPFPDNSKAAELAAAFGPRLEWV